MANFHPSELVRRHNFLENTVARLEDATKNPAVQAYLGATTVSSLTIMCNSLYIADNRDGVVRLPARLRDTEAIPLVALAREETVQQDPSAAEPTPKQKERIKQTISTWGEEDEAPIKAKIKATFEQHTEEITNKPYRPRMEGGIRGFVLTSYLIQSNKDELLDLPAAPRWSEVHGRPLLALAHTPEYLNVIALGHELLHVDQQQQKPVKEMHSNYGRSAKDERDRLFQVDELQAYHFGAVLGEVLDQAGLLDEKDDYDYRLHQDVNKARRRNMSIYDPYEPNDKMLEEIAKLAIIMPTARTDTV